MNNQRLDSVYRVFSGRLPRRSALARLTRGAAARLLASSGLRGAGTQHAAAQSATPAGASAYIIIRRYQLLLDAAMDDRVKRVSEGFVPIVSQIPGLEEYLLVEAGHGAHLTISLCDDPSAAEQSTQNAVSWPPEAITELIAGPPEVTTGWVRNQVDTDESIAATPAL